MTNHKDASPSRAAGRERKDAGNDGDRPARLSAALRENLKRRKAQARARATGEVPAQPDDAGGQQAAEGTGADGQD